jgi:hypothetical protein
MDPAHADLVGAHIGPEDVVGDIGKRRRETADKTFLFRRRHLGVAEKDRFSAAMTQARSRVLQGHGTSQAKALLGRDVLGHTQPADGRPRGDIVDHQNTAQPDRRLLNVDYLRRPQIVAQRERIGHLGPSRAVPSLTGDHRLGSSLSIMEARYNRRCFWPSATSR